MPKFLKSMLMTALFGLSTLSSPTSFADNLVSGQQEVNQTINEVAFEQALSSFIHKLNSDFDLTSATAIAVVKNDKVIYQRSFGFADVKNKQVATDDTLFYIASITKPMFALAFLQALEAKKLTINTTLAELFPTVQFAKNIPADKITVQHLLNHTSGLADNGFATALAMSGDYDKKRLLNLLATLPLNSEAPLNHFDYTNLGYNILSLAMPDEFSQSWQQSVTNSVFLPLNMQHSTTYISDIATNNWSYAKPYSFFLNQTNDPIYLEKQDNTMHAAGGVMSTIGDMAKFLLVQLNNGKLNNTHVIPQRLIEQSQQTTAIEPHQKGDFERTGYGLGWYSGNYKNHLLYHHFGGFSGYRPHLSFMPKQHLGLVILNNEGDLNDKLTDLIADFVYSNLLMESNADTRIVQQADKLKSQAFGMREKIQAKELSYTTMPMMLSSELTNYTGHFKNPNLGSISVKENSAGQLEFNWGNMTTVATGINKPESVRVKFIPTRPQVISYQLVGNDVTALEYDGIVFSK